MRSTRPPYSALSHAYFKTQEPVSVANARALTVQGLGEDEEAIASLVLKSALTRVGSLLLSLKASGLLLRRLPR